MWLLGTSPRGCSILVPQGGRRGGLNPSSATSGVLGSCPAPHLPPCPTPPAALVPPPPRQEMRTSFFALLADVGDHSGATSCPPPRHNMPARGHGKTQPPPSLYPNRATSCHSAQPCLRGRDRRARWQSHLHRVIPSIPLPRLHPCGREPTGGPIPLVTLGPGFSRSHMWSLEEVVHVAGAAVPSLLRAPNRVSHGTVPWVLLEPWVGCLGTWSLLAQPCPLVWPSWRVSSTPRMAAWGP